MSLRPMPWQNYDGIPRYTGIWQVELLDGTRKRGNGSFINWREVKRFRYGGL